MVLEWGAATGGPVATDGMLRLPPTLPEGYALVELKRLARELGLMPRIVFTEPALAS